MLAKGYRGILYAERREGIDNRVQHVWHGSLGLPLYNFTTLEGEVYKVYTDTDRPFMVAR